MRREKIGGERRGFGRGAGQVVIRNGRVVRPLRVLRTMLDREADGLAERDRILDMPAVGGDPPAVRLLDYYAVIRSAVSPMVEVPAGREIVLCARALDDRF